MDAMHDRPRLLIFDWDGTLMDSERQIVTSLQAANADLNLPERSEDDCKNIIGLGLREAIATLYPGTDEKFAEHYTERYRHHWFRVSSQSELFSGAREMLQQLHSLGYLLAVATGKGRVGLDRVLIETGLEHVFHATRCSDETRSKPHPLMLQEIMQTLGIGPEQTLMVGDTEYDMAMARKAGAGPVAVSYGVHAPERLQQYSPLTCLDTLAEFIPWLHHYQKSGHEYSNHDKLTVAQTSE